MSIISALSHSTTQLCTSHEAVTVTNFINKENGSVMSDSITDSSSDISGPVNLNTAYSFNNKSGRLKCESYEALFIGDLDINITESHLVKIFSKYDSFISSKICINKFTKKSLGHGYLNFGIKEDAELAIEELNYTKIMSKEIRLMPSMRDIKNRTTVGTTVLFSNIQTSGFNFATRIFFEAFRKYGKILTCKLENSNNVAYITYFQKEDAENVIRLFNGVLLNSQIISCSIFTEKYLREKTEQQVIKIGNINSGKELIINQKTKEISFRLAAAATKRPIELAIDKSQTVSCAKEQSVKDSDNFTVVIKNFPLKTTIDNIPSLLRSFEDISITQKVRQKQTWVFVRNISANQKEKLIKEFDNVKISNKILTVHHFLVKKKPVYVRSNKIVELTNL
ncbi:hypothetical protein C6P45_005210 [Maudiozyma exigua]|uniref:RRM domain-containing protein n=1 Tax=Maudiozyma exigua TaxID=34358 RepID=A0A9P6W937_MAUEX|nr:hypothetical protein C6P45_005210 [Kazachstania exigua]